MKNMIHINVLYNLIYLSYMIFMLESLLSFKYIILNIQVMCLFTCFFLIFCLFYFMNNMHIYNNSLIPLVMVISSIMFSIMLFFCSNTIYFFVNFEMSVIPIFLYIMYFSMTEKKILSSFYLLIYTSLFSMLFLCMLMMDMNLINSNLSMMMMYKFISNFSLYKVLMILIFVVKIPVFFFHIWLPKAHVESSSMGSMILAGISLKLGSTGMLIFLNSNFSYNIKYFLSMYMMASSIYVLLICFLINDMKMITAYFSVTHMMLFIFMVISMNLFYLNMSIIMMISHSISSSMMFLFCSLLYKNYSSRAMMKVNSMFKFSNMYSWFLFIMFMMNISVPPTINFLTEMMGLYIILMISMNMLFPILLFVLMSGMVTILMVAKMMMFKEMMTNPYFFSFNMVLVNIFTLLMAYSIILLVNIDKLMSIN